jgi:hypothetical protein
MEAKQGIALQAWAIRARLAVDDGGRLDHLFYTRAAEGDAQQVALVVVNDHPAATGGAVGIKA